MEGFVWADTLLYIFGPSAIIAAVILYVALVVKSETVRKLQNALKNLQQTYDDLDKQAKLIIKTDLELHNAQGELDKKISGLYTLQKISHILSTTLDENEIFTKISTAHLTELRFEKAVSFIIDHGTFKSLDSQGIDLKLAIGYNIGARLTSLTWIWVERLALLGGVPLSTTRTVRV